MSGGFLELFFNSLKGSDIDYLINCQKKLTDNIIITSHKFVPNYSWESTGEPYWDNIDVAINYCLQDGWTLIDVYDVYSPFEKALIKSIKDER